MAKKDSGEKVSPSMAVWQKKLDELEDFKRKGQISYSEYQKERKSLESQKPPTSKAIITTLVVIAIVFVLGVMLVNAVSTESDKRAEEQKEANAAIIAEKANERAANRASTIDKYAPEYCKTHRSTRVTFEDKSFPSNDGAGFTDEECRKVIEILYDRGASVAEIEGVVNSTVWIGMSETEVWYSLGNPDKVNTFNYGNGTTKQLVYGYNYVYTDSNGLVTSWQF